MLIVFDENYSPNFAKGIKYLQLGNPKSPIQPTVEHIIDLIGKRGATDEEIIEFLKNKNAIIITMDADFKRIKHYKTLYKTHKVGAVFFKSYKQMNIWDMTISFIKKWEDLKVVLSKATLPCVFEINKQGVQQHHF